MPSIRFEYIFDPLCGWCYASAPALAGLARAWPDQLEMLPSGLFSGAGARAMSREWADYAWTNDQRIAAMTGQVFSEAYRRDVLLRPGVRFDSGTINRVLTAVGAIDKSLEPKVLHALQRARYVEGQDTAVASVVAQITAEVAASNGHALDAAAFARRLETDTAIARDTHARIDAAQTLMSQFGIRGVPQLLVHVDGDVKAVDSAALYQGPERLIDALRALIGEALPRPSAV